MFGDQYDEFFGKFSSSMFTMIQIATGDGWYSLVARQIRNDDGSVDKWASAFFASYMLVVGVVLLNIVVAVLLGVCVCVCVCVRVCVCVCVCVPLLGRPQ